MHPEPARTGSRRRCGRFAFPFHSVPGAGSVKAATMAKRRTRARGAEKAKRRETPQRGRNAARAAVAKPVRPSRAAAARPVAAQRPRAVRRSGSSSGAMLAAAQAGPPAQPGAADRRLASSLNAWFQSARRPLPWREAYEPYAVWIAEMMLQQTQVDTVLPYYRRWMERFPTVAAVAAAPLETVLKAWEGLGYYGRARNLHRTAQAIVKRHGGRVPEDVAALRALPGVGPYTAGAIASIAFNRPEPLVDGNVARVLGRLDAVTADPASPAGRGAAWASAGRLLAGALAEGIAPREFNEALMELGALVCRPRAPQCLLCPWQADCRARLTGNPEAYPPRGTRKARPVRRGVMLLARRPSPSGEPAWLLRRRPPRGVWGGLWEFPWAEPQGEEESAASLCAALLAELGESRSVDADGVPLTPLGHVSHGLTHFQLELDCVLLALPGSPPGSPASATAGAAEPRVRWVTRAELEALPLARLSHKALALVRS